MVDLLYDRSTLTAIIQNMRFTPAALRKRQHVLRIARHVGHVAATNPRWRVLFERMTHEGLLDEHVFMTYRYYKVTQLGEYIADHAVSKPKRKLT